MIFEKLRHPVAVQTISINGLDINEQSLILLGQLSRKANSK